MIITLMSLLASLGAIGYGLWRLYWSPEAQLAKVKAEEKARKAAVETEAARLKEEYERIEKEPTGDEQDLLDRLNR